jgi:hypothetical protein
MEWPAPPSGVLGSPANQEEEGMDISVLGIDLGKNVCSVVGLDASGAVVMRRKVRRGTLIALAEKLPPCVVGMRGSSSRPRVRRPRPRCPADVARICPALHQGVVGERTALINQLRAIFLERGMVAAGQAEARAVPGRADG